MHVHKYICMYMYTWYYEQYYVHQERADYFTLYIKDEHCKLCKYQICQKGHTLTKAIFLGPSALKCSLNDFGGHGQTVIWLEIVTRLDSDTNH